MESNPGMLTEKSGTLFGAFSGALSNMSSCEGCVKRVQVAQGWMGKSRGLMTSTWARQPITKLPARTGKTDFTENLYLNISSRLSRCILSVADRILQQKIIKYTGLYRVIRRLLC